MQDGHISINWLIDWLISRLSSGAQTTYQVSCIVDHAVKYDHNNIELYVYMQTYSYTGLLLGDFKTLEWK